MIRTPCGSVQTAAAWRWRPLFPNTSDQDRVTLILPLFLELASDNSWRVRFTTVTEIGVICDLFSKEIVETKLLPEFLHLLQDPEVEVRTAAASSLSTICKYLSVRAIVEKVLTLLTDLSNDPCEHVRIGLAGDFLSEKTSID